MKAFEFKMIFSTVVLVASSLFEQAAMANSNPPMYYQGLNVYKCERTVKDLFPYFDEKNMTSDQNDDRYNNERVQIEAACKNNSSPYFVMCAMDLIDATYVGERNPNGGQLKWGDYNVEGQTLRKVKTLEAVCGSAKDITYKNKVSCVSDLFLRGGVRMTSDDPSVMTGIRLCATNNKMLYKCITDRYQSRQYTGNQAATSCVNEFYPSAQAQPVRVDSKMIDAAPDEAANTKAAQEARDAYNREQAKKQQQQSSTRTPPASSSSSSGDVIEDLPSL